MLCISRASKGNKIGPVKAERALLVACEPSETLLLSFPPTARGSDIENIEWSVREFFCSYLTLGLLSFSVAHTGNQIHPPAEKSISIIAFICLLARRQIYRWRGKRVHCRGNETNYKEQYILFVLEKKSYFDWTDIKFISQHPPKFRYINSLRVNN